jgi:hypothetical protein
MEAAGNDVTRPSKNQGDQRYFSIAGLPVDVICLSGISALTRILFNGARSALPFLALVLPTDFPTP